MASFEEQMSEFQKQVEALIPTTKQKEAANVAGAEVLKNELEQVTREKHYSRKKDSKFGHMADHIEVDNKNIDGVEDGSATVGWPNRYHAMNAMRLNDGTVFIKADHFVDETREKVANEVFKAQAKKLGFDK